MKTVFISLELLKYTLLNILRMKKKTILFHKSTLIALHKCIDAPVKEITPQGTIILQMQKNVFLIYFLEFSSMLRNW